MPGATPGLRAQLLARLTEAMVYCGEWDDAIATSSAALSAADDADDADALVAALRARQLACSGPDQVDERARLATVMIATGQADHRPDVEMWDASGRSMHTWNADGSMRPRWSSIGSAGASTAQVVRCRGGCCSERGPRSHRHGQSSTRRCGSARRPTSWHPCSTTRRPGKPRIAAGRGRSPHWPHRDVTESATHRSTGRRRRAVRPTWAGVRAGRQRRLSLRVRCTG